LYITLENLRNQRFAEGQLLEIIRKTRNALPK